MYDRNFYGIIYYGIFYDKILFGSVRNDASYIYNQSLFFHLFTDFRIVSHFFFYCITPLSRERELDRRRSHRSDFD